MAALAMGSAVVMAMVLFVLFYVARAPFSTYETDGVPLDKFEWITWAICLAGLLWGASEFLAVTLLAIYLA